MVRKQLIQKKKMIRTVGVLAAMLVMLGGCSQKKSESNSTQAKETGLSGEELTMTNPMDQQKQVDDSLKKELEQGYSFDKPLIVLDPYGNSPLSAVAIFTTEDKTAITLTVKGKEAKDRVTQTFEAGTEHILPIYGLYAGRANEVVLKTEDGRETTVSVETDTLAFDPGKIEVRMEQEALYDYGQFTFVSNVGGYMYALDSKGDVRFYRKGLGMPLKQLKNGHIMYCSSTTLKGNYYQSGLVETDLLGKIYKEYVIPGGIHHDFFEMDNGNLLVSSDAPDFSSVEDYVVEIDRETGKVVYELDMKKLLDPKDGGSINRTDEDWFHNNGIWYDEETDTILLSARHVDAIVGIDKSDKKLSFILGDPDGWENVDKSLFFTPTGEDFEWQYAQHQVSLRPDGTILMFDNGAGRTKATKKDQKVTKDQVYSRAVAYKADRKTMTIEQVFEYGKERGKDWYSEWISGVVCLNLDANHLWITSGAHLYNPENKSCDYGPDDMFQEGLEKSTIMTELKDGKPVIEIQAGSLSYRSIRMPMYWDEKGLNLASEGKYLGSRF